MIHISEKFLIGHIEETFLDLKDIPEFPDIKAKDQRFIGIVTRCESHETYAFVITNQFGVNESSDPAKPVQLYLDKKHWKDSLTLQEGMWITFNLVKQKNKKRCAALNASSLSDRSEDYEVARNYLGAFGTIDGIIRGNRFTKSIISRIQFLFLSTPESRKVVLEDLYKRNSIEIQAWEALFSYMSDEELQTFEFDTFSVDVTAEMWLSLYNYSHRLDVIKNDCVISLLAKSDKPDSSDISKILNYFTSKEDLDNWLKFVAESHKLTDNILIRILQTKFNKHVYHSIHDKSLIIDTFKGSHPLFVKNFLDFAFDELHDNDLKFICDSFDNDQLLRALSSFPIDRCVQLMGRLAEDTGIRIATSEMFNKTEVFKIFIGDKWAKHKSEIDYVVFDLESDGNTISEFAYYSEDNMRSYSGEDQLKPLLRKLSKCPILVGHNIKQWDLPILYKMGLELKDSTFVWDTLEMEILLDPCRYAYSLHANHNAESDTRLTNDLFWNQLYRLSVDESLVNSLKDVLPSDINAILEYLKIDYFSEYFKNSASTDKRFFQELRPISNATIAELNKIANIPSDEQVLIIAPRNIWARIAQYVPLAFPSESNAWMSVDIRKLNEERIENKVMHTILERFCSVSRTPLVSNLAQYLCAESESDTKITFTDEFLEKYVSVFESHIDCIDISGFECKEVLNRDYKHIFTIGTELDDRIHKCKACESKSFADLLSCGSKLPFTMASTNYAPVKSEEIARLGIKMPELAANVWVERDKQGQFVFYRNYHYKPYREHFLSHFSVKPSAKKWALSGTQGEKINLTQVSRAREADMVMRLSSSTTQRSKYWLIQFALISKIHQAYPDKAIIYIVNDSDEREQLVEYARSLGYYIPSAGSSFRKLEYIGYHAHGMIIITKQEFTEGIGSYRTDRAYCYIWDNMDIDRYMLMWDKLPFDDDMEEGLDDERDDKVHHSTPRQVIHAAWPVYEHYCSVVMANHKDTQCFIIDPYFDDYEDIANSCNAQTFKVSLWESNEQYVEGLNLSSSIFTDKRSVEDDIDTNTAMELIRSTFIGGFDWKETQKEVIPHILEKRGDCIISMPTGEGKSVCFHGPAIFKASVNRKLSIVVTPLRALMQDQVENLQKRGFTTNVDYLSGDRQRPEVENIYRKIRSGELALLFITPERFRVKSFINVLNQRMEMDGGLEYVIFDEAHCISQWGQDFRPDYRNAVLKCNELRKNHDFMFAMFSATVTTQVEADIRNFLPEITRLGQSAEEYNPIRQHIGISFGVVPHENTARLSEIVDFIEREKIDFRKSCMLVFCRTHRQCEDVSDMLNEYALNADPHSIMSQCADKVGFYHAGLDADLRNDVYEQFKRIEGVSPIYILCATKAFGMGMDIPNVHYVVHFNPPSVLEDYLQEVGRAGRDEGMYRKAFENERQIPALCLTSADDFKKLKELLVKNQMSWSNLTDAKDRIVDYIKGFQSIDQTRTKPVVVPFDVWMRNPDILDDSTSSRLAFHWLEKIGHIRLGFLSQAHIDITINNRDAGSSLNDPIYRYLIDNTEGDRSLVSLSDMRSSLKTSLPKIMNTLLKFMRRGDIVLNETMVCNIVPRRYCEARYMVRTKENKFALHIAFQGLRNILHECKINEVRSIGQEERQAIFRHLMDDVEYDLIEENGKKYMPWKDEVSSPPKMAVLIYNTFRKNVLNRLGAQMFSILYYLPMVSYKVQREEDEILCQIKVKDRSWINYLDKLENDCLRMIEFAVKQTGPFNWAEAIIDFGWMDGNLSKGYRYFEDVLSILHHLSYIEHTPLSKNGVEVYTSESTELPIDDGTDELSAMYPYRKDFDNQEQIKKIRLACMSIFSMIKKDDQADFIRRYFLSRSFEDYLALAGDYAPEDSDILSEVTEEALKIEEARLNDNAEQKEIYEQPKNSNVNVLAGPGAGKTHVLTLRCARLIYKEHIDPSHILVLAYNRAVVVELRNRLNSLFTKLGMSRIAHQLHVYTFHALARKCLGKSLDKIPTEMWEVSFLHYLKNNVKDFITHFRNIEFVLVDEFQDITAYRLESLALIHNIFKEAKFFTIGDINQSIYGFDRIPKDIYGYKKKLSPEAYAQVLDPKPYYEKWDKLINPRQLSMFTNYRSYQKILDKASGFLSEGNAPRSASVLMKYEPSEPYVFETDNTVKSSKAWFDELSSIVNWAKQENVNSSSLNDNNLKRNRHIDTIAVFFRTNNEVYRGYSKIKGNLPDGVRIRIQGESIGELWRMREIYFLIATLQKHSGQLIVLKNDKTIKGIKNFLKKKMDTSPNWDALMLDVAFCLVLNYVDSIRSDQESHTWQDLADYIIDIASRDDAGQVYKIYDNYRNERILQEPVIDIVLTTMHKVKGLEFDVVLTTPSFAGLPLINRYDYKDDASPKLDDLADIEEEKRLMYVAYTRAKKRLYIYKASREIALENNRCYLPPEYDALKYTETSPGLDKYFLSFTAKQGLFENIDPYVLDYVKKDDPVKICKDQYGNFCIIHNSRFIGRLSKNSSIVQMANLNSVNELSDFYISSVFVWTYEDTKLSDVANNTDFSKMWSEKAKEQGYVNIVQIAGFGKPTK